MHMDHDGSIEPQEFARAFQRLLDWLPTATASEDGFAARLREHFDADPSALPATKIELADHDRPNVQVALDAYLARPDVEAELLGFAAAPFVELSLGLLTARRRQGWSVDVGPVSRTIVALDEGRALACVTLGLLLVRAGGEPLAILVAPQQRYAGSGFFVEVMAAEESTAERVLRELRGLMVEHNVYGRKVISLAEVGAAMGSKIEVTFHSRRPMARDRIVLPAGVLEGVERNTLQFDRHTAALVAQGRHLRRGILLYGAPGTGKTLTATYLAHAMEHRTVLILTGRALGLIRATCLMARDLQPAMVVLEDIDLVAEERTRMGAGRTALLFELLNEIDGIGEDADVVFLMTTNRAEIIEPALAARPGRVDHAVEFPLPDAAARAKLLELYCQQLDADRAAVSALVDRTAGASPAFLRELVRKASLLAAIDAATTTGARHFDDALAELESGGQLARSILGAGADVSGPPPASDCG